MSLTLERGTGDITLISKPPNATITLEPQFPTPVESRLDQDGFAGRRSEAAILKAPTFTPQTITGLPAGEYRLKLVSGDYVHEASVVVENGDTTVVNWDLQKDQNAPLRRVVLINDGDRQTSSPDVILSCDVTDEIDVDQMMISNKQDFVDANWEPYASKVDWKLPARPPGSKKVWIKFRDAVGKEERKKGEQGNISKPYSAEIELLPPPGMIYIPPTGVNGGTSFLMGNKDGEPDEKPEHEVKLSAYYIDQFEVTNAQYKAFIDATGRPAPEYWIDGNYPPGMGDYPVVSVSWYDADAYAKWVGNQLPTEAQWERAALGTKLKVERPKWAWGNRWNGLVTNFINPFEQNAGIMPVHRFPKGKTEDGLYNMSGNVWEWVADSYDSGYYKEGIIQNPQGPKDGTEKVIRGGLAIREIEIDSKRVHRITPLTNREKADPNQGYGGIGFRCVLPIDEN